MLSGEKRAALILLIITSIVSGACYRKDIQFGDVPENGYTRLVYTDTVEARLSTVLTDSFATNSASSFLLGKYKDPYLGIISTKPFFQITIPASASTLSIPVTAHYDSTCLIIYLNKYFYGDTSRSVTMRANELAEPIGYTYGTNLFNTSSIPEKPIPLGSRLLTIRPSVDDSVMIRLSDAKGTELFNKLQQQAAEITSEENFLNYFNGISLSVNASDTSAVYGLNSSAGKIIMRIFYHLTTPVYESQSVDFTSLNNTYSFNQIITDRTNTPLYSTTGGVKEFPSEQTNDFSFTQYGAGVLLKVTFPSLKGILQSDNTIKLLKAELLVKPVGPAYNNFLKLPSSLFLSQTDATNTIGPVVADSLGSELVADPVIDGIYGINTNYRFTITSYINRLLTTAGTESSGFFLMEDKTSPQVNRAVIGNAHSNYKTQLLLTIAIINK